MEALLVQAGARLSDSPGWCKAKKIAFAFVYNVFRPPQSAQFPRLSWRHILENCKIGGTFEEI